MLTVMSNAGMSSTGPSIILDCDPGHDDAVAIIAAARFADLVGITTVAGNAPLERTTRNALVMRDLLGIAVPVHSGSDRPLVEPTHFAPFVHGESGLDGADLPTPTTPRRDRRRHLHRRHVPGDRGDLARTGRAPDQHRPGVAGGARSRRPHRRDLDDGRWKVRQPHRRRPSSTSGPTPRRPTSCSGRASRW